MIDVYQKHPTFLALRDPDRFKGRCGICEFRRVCGGSRARAYALTGDFLETEPDCATLRLSSGARQGMRVVASGQWSVVSAIRQSARSQPLIPNL